MLGTRTRFSIILFLTEAEKGEGRERGRGLFIFNRRIQTTLCLMLDSATDRQTFPVVFHFAIAKSHFFLLAGKLSQIFYGKRLALDLK